MPSPFAVVFETIKEKVHGYLLRKDRALVYRLTGRTPEEVVKRWLLFGVPLGLLVILLAWESLGVLSVAAALILVAAILFALDAAVANEYRRWRDKLVDGIPVLAAFVPAFLETGVVTPRRALELALPFLPEPLRSELDSAVGSVARSGCLDAFDELKERARHPLVDAVCFRLKAGWDTGLKPDVFTDLNEQIRDAQEVAAARATAAKSALVTLVSVIGLLGAGLVFGYPAWKHITGTMGGMFR
ncbi:hypothetical protein SAMN02745218_01197 [Desulfofundulus australicus DSM 11792]|uniref:Flp pilus assembly protein TadB n=1 Tax=Desulfofundulus australicus DSM 11792 TaxID=1121425 RepID=A0A1M4XWM5_9FIRM|nr:hypothetical protein [Desulfofundulus australicus]SHE97840.1 hypothetical protein SAMN02745218_01197 [Desulfofundulus australicus DSM 11792]